MNTEVEPGRHGFWPINLSSSVNPSLPINLGNFVPTGVIIPGTFTGTALTFQAAREFDSDYYNLHDSAGAEVSVTVASNRYVAFSAVTAELFKGVIYLKVRSGTAASPTSEGAARTIILVGAIKF